MRLKVILTSLSLLLVSAMPAFAGIYIDWTGPNCGEFSWNRFTGSRVLIRLISRNVCRQRLGSRFRWMGGACGEFTPRGSFIRYVGSNACRFALLDLPASGTDKGAVADLDDPKSTESKNSDAAPQLDSAGSKLGAE